MKQASLPYALLIFLVAVVSGCGGGGGTSTQPDVSGTVTDVAGNLVPGASIYLDGRKVTTSLMNGTYKFSASSAGYHNVGADTTISGKLWGGTRAVDVFRDGPTQNQNIVIGDWDDRATIEGAVTDVTNHAIPNARVIALARYPQDRPADQSSVISKVVVANDLGEYVMDDLPASVTVQGVKVPIDYDVVASSVGLSGQSKGFDNVKKTAAVEGGKTTLVSFALPASSTVVPEVPTGWTQAGTGIYAVSYTVPTAITSRAELDAYDGVKCSISERNRKVIALKRRLSSRAAPSGSLIENDVVWYSIWAPFIDTGLPANLAGFSIYRGVNGKPQQSGRFQIDFFRDPAIVSYADTSNDLTAGTTYWYGVSAVSTSYLDSTDQFNPDAESPMSYPVAVKPLNKLRSLLPNNGATVDKSNAVFTWSPVSGAVNYRVFIYESYPIVDTLVTPRGDLDRPDHLPAWGQSIVTSASSVKFTDVSFPLVAGHTYWWVVMASDYSDFANANAYAISELRSFKAR